MKRFFSVLLVCLFLLMSCSIPGIVWPSTIEKTPTYIITPTSTISPTFTPEPTITLIPTKEPASVICPILLYHHIKAPETPSPLFVTPEDFRAQMQFLHDNNYTTISVTKLVQAIHSEVTLPEKPIIISFDDNGVSIYNEAYPVMREFGFIGVNYLVGNRLGSEGFMSVAQLKELSAAGWEMGSHSMTHVDLTQTRELEWELTQSKASLESKLGISVETFAYPFGSSSAKVLNEVRKSYSAAVGLGVFLEQRPKDIYYLWRRPVDYGIDMKTFASFLPAPTPTPVP